MSFDRTLIAAALALTTAACSTPEPRTDWIDPGMGEAVAWNKNLHVINPDPVYRADGAQPGANGERAADATERYRKGEVKDVKEVNTTSSGSGGGDAGPR
ncbi:hypothetical protein ACFQPG_03145 [Sphingomonas sp. GCM10030256]|uniref:hypothetical protein n=1 Tax=Sphingomonas sp. GCM10030256 TaxID=3273427 RepID=UPI003607E200